MKAKLSLIAVALACSGCVAVAPLLKEVGVSNVHLAEMERLMGTAEKIGRSQRELSEDEEIALGSGVASNMLGIEALWKDQAAQRYVNRVGSWLARHTSRPDLPWHFAVLDSAELNAFAAPGGYIFITRALLQSMRSEAELAGVLAHEIAHVVQKHHLTAIAHEAGRDALADLAQMALARKPGLTRHGALTPVLNRLASVGVALFARGLDKDDEFEADRMGVVIAARAGYDPYGLPAVLQLLQTVNPNYSGLTLLFKTHPTFEARLDQLAGTMTQQFDRFDHQPALAARLAANVSAPRAPRQRKQ